jgi:hypothetical protein
MTPLGLVKLITFKELSMSTPFSGKEFTFTQPDGTPLKVRGWGDQRHAVFETLTRIASGGTAQRPGWILAQSAQPQR